MRVLRLARERRSTRSYLGEEVEMGKVLYALEVARHAPSGSNRQPWRFLVVTNPQTKARIREAAEEGERAFYASLPEERRSWYQSKGLSPSKPMLTQAPVLVVVLGDESAPNYRPSVWVSIGYLILAAQEVGLSTLTYTPSNPRLVAEALGVPRGFTVEAVIPLGLPRGEAGEADRRPLSESVFLEEWGRGLGNP